MTLRTILVCLTGVDTAPALLDAASLLARRDNAHVVGLHVTESLILYPSIAVHVPETSFEQVIASQRAAAEAIKVVFDARMQAEDFPSQWRQVKSDSGFLSDAVLGSARSADLVIMAQEDGAADAGPAHGLAERVIRAAGRPVLVVPGDHAGDSLGENVVLGWSDTREAARALHDALAVASPKADMRMVHIGKPPADALTDDAANDMAAALVRHGPKVTVVHRDSAGSDVAHMLMREAFEAGADMLATGAFGHSRAYDFVLGAVTGTLLREAKLPVLYSK